MAHKLSPTDIAQYVRLENCERYLSFRLNPDVKDHLSKKWRVNVQPLTPLLSDLGIAFERRVVEYIGQRGEKVIDLEKAKFDETVHLIGSITVPTIFFQPTLQARLWDYDFSGRADVIRASKDKHGHFHFHIADIKASRVEHMEYRLQIAIYALMLRKIASTQGWTIADIKGSVLLRSDTGEIPALEENTPTFDLAMHETIVERLMAFPDSVVNRIAREPFENIFYHLSYKCDGCFYNALCMHDSAERLDLALTPNISPVEKRVLLESGIDSLPKLAQLMNLPTDTQSKELIPNPAFAQQYAFLHNRWPVAPNLPFLVQRARAAVKQFDPSIQSKSYMLGAGFGTLPSADDHPDLVKIFFDSQYDYLRDRVYLLSGIVSGPKGNKAVVKFTSAPPTDEDEKKLLKEWVQEVLRLVQDVSSSTSAPVHLYCYSSYDQNVLLNALKRHLVDVASLPAFFDIMTQSPALSQPMISFLADELRDRFNLGMVCMPLHDVARRLGFSWKDDNYNFSDLFRERLFDNHRAMRRHDDGSFEPFPHGSPGDEPNRQFIESAARFNSQIPLEYAYAAWKCLPDAKEDNRILEPFRKITLEHLRWFAVQRIRALAHIEGSIKFKARFIQKAPLSLPPVDFQDAPQELAKSLIEFLHMEHHSSLQAKLLTYSLPIDRRVQAGQALLLKFTLGENAQAHFVPEFTEIGLDPNLTMSACKLKEGDWVVMNDAMDNTLSANKIKNGRLAVIEELSPNKVILKFMDLYLYRKKFAYPHNQDLVPQKGRLYCIDTMADDLNGDKILEALQNTSPNVLYQWLLDRPQPKFQNAQVFSGQFVAQVSALLATKKRKLTDRQMEIISEHLDEPLILVQGPPGTGKSYTLAWAILGRMASAIMQGKSCRVAISCKTHNAINVVLKALADAHRQLTAIGMTKLGGQALQQLKIYKVGSDDDATVPSGVEKLDAYANKSALPALLGKPIIIFGATSGGIYNLMKYSSSSGKTVEWNRKVFDLLVIDEASQMSVPEGVLAGAFLKSDGQVIVVGDHRQMPPITSHAWKDEQKRTITTSRPYLSLFEFLAESGFPRVALDESFRLHEDLASFLSDNVYSKDGIRLFSKRRELIPALPKLDDYIGAVLSPEHPIVVIEHGEMSSQQFNTVELELTRPLIDACVSYLSLDGKNGIGVVVPHRAQKALLCQQFPDLARANSIDTVERFQGDERDVIIVSATASDPDYVRSEASFLLNLNRLNVAISRPRKKLIVVASKSVIDLLTSDLDVFDNSVIWKRLYYQYASTLLLEATVHNTPVFVKGRRATIH